MKNNASSVKIRNFISIIMLVIAITIALICLFSAFYAIEKKENIAIVKIAQLCQLSSSVEDEIAILESDFSNSSKEKERVMAHEKIMQKKMDLILIENRISTYSKRWRMTCDNI